MLIMKGAVDMTNVEVFDETMSLIVNNENLRKTTVASIENTRVYKENTVSEKNPSYNSRVSFEENLTLITAEKLVSKGKKTAVLNFANAIEPGGGVLRGANAQEEYLCRASNLFLCLISDQARPFYDYHNEMIATNSESYFLASDMLIYSSDVTVFRKDEGYDPKMPEIRSLQKYTDSWYTIDVITCAAPFFSDATSKISDSELKEIFKKRIRNIFETAIQNDVESIVLGAFGCGAFHNPPAVVAGAFFEVLQETRYKKAFADIVFAVKPSGHNCRNVVVFKTVFSDFLSE